jgi:predicted RNase H-like nuclease (RuvC/YqgF family)
MLEKLIIAGSIALAASIYPAIKIYQGAKIPMYQTRISNLEHKLEIIKVTESDPAARYVKISKVEGKIFKLRGKIKERQKIKAMEAKWEYQDEMLKLKRSQVSIDSTIKLDPK